MHHILIDGGSAVNILPKSTMSELEIMVEEISKSHLVIQGLNLGSQRAIGMIRVVLSMEDMPSTMLFHIIDSKTSYKLLLGRPWLHENGVVASTLHQCLKYFQDGEKKINGDVKPFTKVEAHITDVKFFEEEVESEVLPPKISSTEMGKAKESKNASSSLGTSSSPKGEEKQQLQKGSKHKIVSSSTKTFASQAPLSKPILRYVLKSRRKEGESPFAEYLGESCEPQVVKRLKDSSIQILKNSVVIPIAKANPPPASKSPLPGFIVSSIKPIIEEEASPHEHARVRFGTISYKLLAKSGCDFQNPNPSGKVIEATPYGFNETQGNSKHKEVTSVSQELVWDIHHRDL